MDPGRPAWPISSPPRVLLPPKSPGVFSSLCLSRLHPIRRRYLQDFFEEKDRMENPSLNLSLLFLPLSILILSCGLCPLSFIGGRMCTNGPLIIMAFGPLFGLWPSSFFVSSRDCGPHHFMLQNWSKTCKNEVPPKYMCKYENNQ